MNIWPCKFKQLIFFRSYLNGSFLFHLEVFHNKLVIRHVSREIHLYKCLYDFFVGLPELVTTIFYRLIQTNKHSGLVKLLNTVNLSHWEPKMEVMDDMILHW